MKIAKVAKSIEGSLTRQLFNLAAQYDDVIDLTLGDPDIPPLQPIKEAACEAIMEGRTRYSANAGLRMLRESIAKNYQRETGIAIDPEKNVAVTVGGMEALYLSLKTIVDEGDEVIIFAPYYANYKQMVKMCLGVPVVVNTYEKNGFIPQVEDIERCVTEKTVAIIINTPSNPTGAVIPKETLCDIAELAKKHNFVVVSDEVYSQLIYDQEKEHVSIATIEGMNSQTIVIDSLSKRQAMTGYRVGFAVAPEEVVAVMVKLQENIAACAPVVSQYAAIAAFEKCAENQSIKDEFRIRRDYIYPAINNIEGLHCAGSAATFYLYVNVGQTGLNGIDFAYQLLEKEHVAVVPGISYGDAYADYIRIAYTMNVDKLKLAIERIERFVNGLKNG